MNHYLTKYIYTLQQTVSLFLWQSNMKRPSYIKVLPWLVTSKIKTVKAYCRRLGQIKYVNIKAFLFMCSNLHVCVNTKGIVMDTKGLL